MPAAPALRASTRSSHKTAAAWSASAGLSSFDVRHRWVLGAVYELPVGKGKLLDINNSIANAFVGGWQLSTNTTIQSGVPQTLTIGINNAGTNNPLPDRPSYSGTGNGYATNRTPSRWFDPASFVVSPQGTFGNVGRNTMLTPHFQSIDMALAKRFTMPYSEQPFPPVPGGSVQRVQPSYVGCAERKHPGGSRHFRERPPTPRIRASASSAQRPSRCARFNWD